MVRSHSRSHALQIHSLASGSSGNAMLVQAGETNLLIDAGIPARNLAAALIRRGVGADGLNAILLTHEHTDHSSSAGAMSRRSRTPLIANSATLHAYAERDARGFETTILATGDCLAVGGIEIRSFRVSHGAAEPVGYVLRAGGTQITYFTDSGCASPCIEEALRGAHLAVVEANHDIDWLWRGPYTADMKARVASDTGHLSNAICAELLAARLDAHGPMCVWLAHLSRVNNSPALARRDVLQRISRQTRVPVTLDVALRDSPSLTWCAGQQAVQLTLL